jgi:hypothetical protein
VPLVIILEKRLPVEMKKCCTCQTEKDIGEFYRYKNGRVYADCKLCTAARHRRNYQKIRGSNDYKERRRSYMRMYRAIQKDSPEDTSPF